MTYMSELDNVAVDLNPLTVPKYNVELKWLGFDQGPHMEWLYGYFLVVTPDGPNLFSPLDFHRKWRFMVPETADRTRFRAITPR